MHELSIASAIVEIVERHAAGRKVTGVDVKVGHLRQVVPDALEFAFELVSKDTVAEGAVLAIEEVPAFAQCRACGAETELKQFPAHCTECGSLDVELDGGDELLVDSLELEDAALIATGG
jgi:hydrogenase nickel incorporation protein HypA/HybF